MRQTIWMLVMLLGLGAWHLAENQRAASDPERVVRQWFEHWNALDGSEAATERIVDLYLPDAMHFTGPGPHQIGPVTYDGSDAIRKMTADFAAAHTEIAYRFQTVTASERSADLFHMADGPWGGVGVAVEFVAAFTERESGRRYMHPGAMFFQVQDGKIRRARTYLGHREKAEIAPVG